MPLNRWTPKNIIGLNGPAWRDVTPTEMKRLPWAAICHVRISDGLDVLSTGTGWLAGERTVVTAAHVVRPFLGTRGTDVTAIFPSGGRTSRAIDILVHPTYSPDRSRTLDPFDVAVLRMSEPSGNPLQCDRPPATQGLVEIAGFPATVEQQFVTQTGPMVCPAADVLLHQVDTSEGHSGAPVVLRTGSTDGVVIAIHVYGFNANPYSQAYPAHNVALALTAELLAFLEQYVRVWG